MKWEQEAPGSQVGRSDQNHVKWGDCFFGTQAHLSSPHPPLALTLK